MQLAKLDGKRRIILPRQVCAELGLETGDQVSVEVYPPPGERNRREVLYGAFVPVDVLVKRRTGKR